MDRILKQLVDDFLKSFEYDSVDPDYDFEIFANYSIITKEYNRSFEIDAVNVGKGDDTGIDGIAIIVNGLLIEQSEDIDNLLASNGALDVNFLFIQAKNSGKFDSSDINTFAFGVRDFFAEKPKLRRNEAIQAKAELSDYLFKKAKHFRENPQCNLFYTTTGIWTGDKNNVAVIDTTKLDLEKLNLFSKISFTPLGTSEITKYYRETKNSTSATFTFSEKVTLPDLPQVNEAYYGLLPLSEFRKLLFDDKDNLLNIFDDNVRDFQGLNNPINKTIEKTLFDKMPQLFTVLNNGVTIVASELKPSGNKFTIIDYQIVNGCQTSNVLSQHANKPELQDLRIPIRLIITDDDEVKNRITIATNSQTAIKREQLQAMKDFQKNLEYFYNTMNGEGRIYYERRTRQYQANNTVPKSRIITVQNQIKSFGAMFLDIPHTVTTYFGEVLKQYVENDEPFIFNPSHKYLPYYTAGLAYYRLDALLRKKDINTDYRKIRFFIIMLLGKIANPGFPKGFKSNLLNSEKYTENYCAPIINILIDQEKSLEAFQKVIDLVVTSGVNVTDKQAIKSVLFTEQLLKPMGLTISKDEAKNYS